MATLSHHVIASVAKQSRVVGGTPDCFAALAMTSGESLLAHEQPAGMSCTTDPSGRW
ncbi:hypothetical protein BRAO375_2970008 [Bradyrhizobium sp. ORS 375]|nr:hypothetical protein BRAO375_2970008 [Bradyrhizobium sp. ORS 375]